MNHAELKHHLPDTKQTIWQLSVIQLSGWMSLPLLATSVFVLQENSFYGAALTILVGNAILWFIRLGIIVMSHDKRQSTLDISRAYLGNVGGHFIGVLLLLSTLAWFIAQTTSASNALSNLLQVQESPEIDQFTQMSILLGVASTLLCMGGITVLRRLSSIAFPVLIGAFVVAIFLVPFQLPDTGEGALSLSGLTLVLATNLGLTSDLPTFFRHSRSLRTSVGALTIIQLVSLVLSICGLYFGSILTHSMELNTGLVLGTQDGVLRLSLILFVFLSVICANVANVYSASVGWEVVAPTALVGRKEYLILGLGLTIIFILVSNLVSVELLLNATDSSLVNLCLVLILGYIVSRLVGRVPTLIEQRSYFVAWLLATVVNIVQYFGVPMAFSPLVVGFGIILAVIAVGHGVQAMGKSH